MIDWAWQEETVLPEDIFDAASTLQVGSFWYEIDPIPNWISGERYLLWARECLTRTDEFGWDAAVCYAKRAVCRQIDAFMVYNHLIFRTG